MIEAQMKNLRVAGAIRPKVDFSADAADSMYRSVGFFGFKAEDDIEFRTRQVDELLSKKFAGVPYSIGFDFQGPRKDGKLKGYCYATFLTRDEADRVLSEIKTKKLETKNRKGENLKFDKPRTAVQRKRWAVMLRAEEMLKNHELARGHEVKLDSKMPVRRVMVNGEVAFEQERDDAIGVFVGTFANVAFAFERWNARGRASLLRSQAAPVHFDHLSVLDPGARPPLSVSLRRAHRGRRSVTARARRFSTWIHREQLRDVHRCDGEAVYDSSEPPRQPAGRAGICIRAVD